MKKKHFVISYYKNADCGIHIQKIENSTEATMPHSHSYFQIYYIVRGSLTHTTETGTSRLAVGDAFIVPPGRSHSIREPENALFYTFSFTEESLNQSYKPLALVSDFLETVKCTNELRPKIKLHADSVIFVENLLSTMLTEFTKKQPGYTDVLRSYATVLLTVLARHYFLSSDITVSASDNRARMRYCVKYIDENACEPLNLTDIAKWCALSKTAFCKQFSELTGTTFVKYLNRVRINRAIILIEKGCKISAVDGLCGYNDFSTFYRNFKKVTGKSPEEYKKSIAKPS